MSALVRCDGPGCDVTMNTDLIERHIGQPHWIRLEQGNDVKDFHSKTCLAKWAKS